MSKVFLSVNAEISVDEAYQFYERRQKPLGDRFLREVESIFYKIKTQP